MRRARHDCGALVYRAKPFFFFLLLYFYPVLDGLFDTPCVFFFFCPTQRQRPWRLRNFDFFSFVGWGEGEGEERGQGQVGEGGL